jgi:hypothetical protein
MTTYDIEPWPSTYKDGEAEARSNKLVSNTEGREVGAFWAAIPPRTIEPPQIHLISPRDGKPFQELLRGFNKDFVVAYFDANTKKYGLERYAPGQDIIIPEFKIHWLINPHDTDLKFICEYAPHPWDGENDEPEFRNLTTLMQYLEENGLKERLRSG